MEKLMKDIAVGDLLDFDGEKIAVTALEVNPQGRIGHRFGKVVEIGLADGSSIVGWADSDSVLLA